MILNSYHIGGRVSLTVSQRESSENHIRPRVSRARARASTNRRPRPPPLPAPPAPRAAHNARTPDKKTNETHKTNGEINGSHATRRRAAKSLFAKCSGPARHRRAAHRDSRGKLKSTHGNPNQSNRMCKSTHGNRIECAMSTRTPRSSVLWRSRHHVSRESPRHSHRPHDETPCTQKSSDTTTTA